MEWEPKGQMGPNSLWLVCTQHANLLTDWKERRAWGLCLKDRGGGPNGGETLISLCLFLCNHTLGEGHKGTLAQLARSPPEFLYSWKCHVLGAGKVGSSVQILLWLKAQAV